MLSQMLTEAYGIVSMSKAIASTMNELPEQALIGLST